MKILNVDTKVKWKIIEAEEDRFVGICDRLGVTMEGSSLEDLVLKIQEVLSYLFKNHYENKDLNEWTFKHSLAYRINDYEKYLDIAPLPIILT